MKVVYITYPWFLDFSIEYIRELSKHVELHVFVISPINRTSSTIFNLKTPLEFGYKDFYSLEDLRENLSESHFFDEYIKDCTSFSFSFFPNKWASADAVKHSFKFKKKISLLNPDIIHLDDLSIDLLWSYLFLKNKDLIIDVHDPVAHKGESNWRRTVIRKLFYSKAKEFISYSSFSSRLFKQNYKRSANTLSLTPYTFYSKYTDDSTHIEPSQKYILFFGRLSAYKGIEKLISAFTEVKKIYPDLTLRIVGKSVYGYQIEEEYANAKGVNIDDRFIPNKEMVNLIRNSQFVVCPYEDATQSGVVMTTLALHKKIIVSRVGGLYEGVDESNGYIYDPSDLNNLQKAMLHLLQRNREVYTVGEKDILESVKKNVIELIKIYERTRGKK